MPALMHDISDIASDVMKYRAVLDAVDKSGVLDDHEDLKENLTTAFSVAERVERLGELASLLEKLGWLEKGGTISQVISLSSFGTAASAFGNTAVAGGIASGIAASTSTSGAIAGVVGGAAAGVGTAAAVGSTATTVVAGIAAAPVAVAAAPFVAGAAVAGAVGYGISKLWSKIW